MTLTNHNTKTRIQQDFILDISCQVGEDTVTCKVCPWEQCESGAEGNRLGRKRGCHDQSPQEDVMGLVE